MATLNQPKSKSPEFKRFEKAVKTILAVPKKEIDKQKAAYQKKRQRVNGSKPKAA
jgi:hypothetical protein